MESYTILMDDSLKASKVVKSYAAEEYEISRINDILKRLYKLSWKTARTSNVPGPLNETLVGVGIAAVLLYGGGLVVGGDATPGSFFAFFAAMMMAYKPLKSLSGINIQMQMCLVCAKRVFEMLDVETKIIDKPNAKILENVKGNIEFDNVTFNYSGNYDSERNALQNINFKLEAGKSYAFVGHSGGGKSTIMNLLLRFYDPVSGVIKIDGNNISDVTINSLRSNISYVGQDVQLFDDTIFENIKYNNISANEEQVVEAAKLAEAHDFISALPERYNMRVGQNGQKLSGGQRQRISIARAILKNSPILLLDEATSALDPVSEKLVQKAFEKLMQGKTTLTIAHRLSTVLKADKIFVLRNGSIIEHGSHKELLSLNGEYANLYSKQFQE
jgi:subfamily B ATP-binding cassette protein MsbA